MRAKFVWNEEGTRGWRCDLLCMIVVFLKSDVTGICSCLLIHEHEQLQSEWRMKLPQAFKSRNLEHIFLYGKEYFTRIFLLYEPLSMSSIPVRIFKISGKRY